MGSKNAVGRMKKISGGEGGVAEINE